MHFLYRIIDNLIQYGTLQDRRYDASGPSDTVETKETVDEVENIFQKIQIPSLEKLRKY